MTESEAIKILQRDLQIQLENKALPDGIEAIQIAIQSLETFSTIWNCWRWENDIR